MDGKQAMGKAARRREEGRTRSERRGGEKRTASAKEKEGTRERF